MNTLFRSAISPWFEAALATRDYPEPAKSLCQEHAKAMLLELARKRLVVGLAPYDDPQDLRRVKVVLSRNPAWYSRLWEMRAYRRPRANPHWNAKAYPTDANIKRAEVVAALMRIAEGSDPAGDSVKASLVYDLKSLILEELTAEASGDEEMGYYECPPQLQIAPPTALQKAIIEVSSPAERARVLGGLKCPFTGLVDPANLPRQRVTVRHPKPEAGLYFLFQGGRLVYIGKSTAIRWRIYDHLKGRQCNPYVSKYDGRPRGSRDIQPKAFDQVATLYVNRKLAELLEPHYIARYRPELNNIWIDQPADQLDLMAMTMETT